MYSLQQNLYMLRVLPALGKCFAASDLTPVHSRNLQQLDLNVGGKTLNNLFFSTRFSELVARFCARFSQLYEA